MSGIVHRALAALPAELQEMARAHVKHHPADDLGDLISELAIALLEVADRATDPARVYARARSRLRRATQDPAHYGVAFHVDSHDRAEEAEPEGPRARADIAREIARARGVTLRRAQQIIKSQIQRAMQGDLFVGGAA